MNKNINGIEIPIKLENGQLEAYTTNQGILKLDYDNLNGVTWSPEHQRWEDTF